MVLTLSGALRSLSVCAVWVCIFFHCSLRKLWPCPAWVLLQSGRSVCGKSSVSSRGSC